MKILLKLIIIFSVVFFLYKCSDESISPNDIKKYYAVSGIIKNGDSIMNNVLIMMDSDSTVSGANGEFTFNNIIEGMHIVRISLSEYELFYDTITVQKDTNIVINLERSIKYYNISGIVLDVISDEFSPVPKKGVPVYIDDDSTISGDDGRFYFSNIIEGKHYIRVTLPNYEPFADTITLSQDTNVALYIYGIKEDYFPLEENTQKLFHYRSSSANVVYVIVDEGTSLWKVGSKSINNTDTVYNVLETIIYTRTINGVPSPAQDTLISQFQITESISKKITFHSSFLDGITFNRFMDPRLEQDGLIPKSYQQISTNITVYLKKNIGFFKINESGFRWGKTYELIQ